MSKVDTAYLSGEYRVPCLVIPCPPIRTQRGTGQMPAHCFAIHLLTATPSLLTLRALVGGCMCACVHGDGFGLSSDRCSCPYQKETTLGQIQIEIQIQIQIQLERG